MTSDPIAAQRTGRPSEGSPKFPQPMNGVIRMTGLIEALMVLAAVAIWSAVVYLMSDAFRHSH